jgi:streptogramin lyase
MILRQRRRGGKFMDRMVIAFAMMFAVTAASAAELQFYQLPPNAYPHDVAPAPDGAAKARESLAASIRRRAATKTSSSDRAQRRMASSSDRTARPG